MNNVLILLSLTTSLAVIILWHSSRKPSKAPRWALNGLAVISLALSVYTLVPEFGWARAVFIAFGALSAWGCIYVIGKAFFGSQR